MFKKGTIGLLLAFICSALLATAAFADEGAVLAVQGGGLTISNPSIGNFSAVTLDGGAQNATAQLGGFTVNDSRGTGEGWHVTAQAEPLREWDGGAYVDGGAALDAGSLEMSAPDVTPDSLTTSPAPSVEGGPYTIDGGGAVTIASAAANTGMGKYDFGDTTLSLHMPPSIFARSYRTSVIISVTSGP